MGVKKADELLVLNEFLIFPILTKLQISRNLPITITESNVGIMLKRLTEYGFIKKLTKEDKSNKYSLFKHQYFTITDNGLKHLNSYHTISAYNLNSISEKEINSAESIYLIIKHIREYVKVNDNFSNYILNMDFLNSNIILVDLIDINAKKYTLTITIIEALFHETGVEDSFKAIMKEKSDFNILILLEHQHLNQIIERFKHFLNDKKNISLINNAFFIKSYKELLDTKSFNDSTWHTLKNKKKTSIIKEKITKKEIADKYLHIKNNITDISNLIKHILHTLFLPFIFFFKRVFSLLYITVDETLTSKALTILFFAGFILFTASAVIEIFASNKMFDTWWFIPIVISLEVLKAMGTLVNGITPKIKLNIFFETWMIIVLFTLSLFASFALTTDYLLNHDKEKVIAVMLEDTRLLYDKKIEALDSTNRVNLKYIQIDIDRYNEEIKDNKVAKDIELQDVVGGQSRGSDIAKINQEKLQIEQKLQDSYDEMESKRNAFQKEKLEIMYKYNLEIRNIKAGKELNKEEIGNKFFLSVYHALNKLIIMLFNYINMTFFTFSVIVSILFSIIIESGIYYTFSKIGKSLNKDKIDKISLIWKNIKHIFKN